MAQKDETSLILQRAYDAGLSASPCGLHLVSKITVLDYIRIADEIKETLQNGNLLDWGCGTGQMSFFLQRRGIRVSSYDIGTHETIEASPVFPEVYISYGIDPVKLPFANATFDAVLSCGVWEHVPDEVASLVEIYRVLRPGGYFFVYNLPQAGSYKEFLLAQMHVGYVHERQYTLASARALLGTSGFQIARARRSGILPHNLTPFPWVRNGVSRMARPILSLDGWLSAIPGLNRIAEALEILAVKPVL